MQQIPRPFESTLSRWTPLTLFATAALAALPAQAVTVFEAGDAGQTLAAAQITSGSSGALTDIFGAISGSTDADLFRINITSPGTFSATTVNVGTNVNLDTQLFLFTLAGAPVYLNDDAAGGAGVQSALPAGNVFGPVAAGQYYLGISQSGYDPVNFNNQLLFAYGLSTDTRGPAAGLQPAVLGGFSGGGFMSGSAAYDIQLTGASVAVVPEPTSVLLFLLGGGALGAARLLNRRKAGAATFASTAV